MTLYLSKRISKSSELQSKQLMVQILSVGSNHKTNIANIYQYYFLPPTILINILLIKFFLMFSEQLVYSMPILHFLFMVIFLKIKLLTQFCSHADRYSLSNFY